MKQIYLRACLLLYTVVLWLRSYAQDPDEHDIMPKRSLGDAAEDMEELMEYQPFRIRFTDILTVVCLIIACYVFGKIWKGCTYLILVIAAVFYFMTH